MVWTRVVGVQYVVGLEVCEWGWELGGSEGAVPFESYGREYELGGFDGGATLD